MFKRFIVGFAMLALFSSQPLSAKKISVSQAKETALRFLGNNGVRRAPGLVATNELSHNETVTTPYYYVFNKERTKDLLSCRQTTLPFL